MEAHYLIFDADDTLWENNIYFEAAFDQFCEYLAHSCMGAAEVRRILDEIEIVNSQLHGYGSRSFGRNLTACFERLTERDISEADLATVTDFAHAILDRPIELLSGVEETLAALSGRHTLTLFTKGDPDEQRSKIERSGLADFFEHTVIVREKNASAYLQLATEREFDLDRTWMIGNSPKSDINPALSVGLSAVYVPHPRTWKLEHEEVPESHPRLLCIDRISELTRYF
ncbi:MAG: HAD family hydrolase [Acidobacteriaceae bacterium]|nr:HAD family hydrolase [Acidobacteriaceae bacterium]MBV9441426.1 HAD family hydrolase [Acidobacteriaceae bacterium]